ncbi:MAG: hypothetical protein KF730_02580 [Sphingomonas sp.]|uniref:hypothetical protein n=1 Tax=Sphingomonas sp. TaxID=28214 RepID=UPI0025D00949|nr:hypothetical protein [Sphingomonas sp.]MBX3563442.1 hypothetical protein [Sphingomonas sp.]
MAFNRIGCAILVVVVAPLALLSSCPRPAWNQSSLKAIKAESDMLMTTYPVHPVDRSTEVPQDKWPPAIARLEPYSVTVFDWGVEISTRPGFDGGWGYGVPRSGKKTDLSMLPECWSEVSPGLFWHGPC